ncbi:MAG: hypothetical protein KatS3mg120_1528 [Erythrobacter sp.]|nr:MAG: hypothetical protein KatS3mg120_1528 [Erythrobacter sp.]
MYHALPMHAPPRPPIPVETLLLAYRSGIFPMADRREDTEVFWVEPRERAILPLDGLHVSRSLRKVVRADRFTVTIDRAFEAVIRACAEPRPDHPETWISERIVQSYLALHRAGHAHSLECWQADAAGAPRLVGGLYGVTFDRVFCGESMFSRVADASKVALTWLVALLREAGLHAARLPVHDRASALDGRARIAAGRISRPARGGRRPAAHQPGDRLAPLCRGLCPWAGRGGRGGAQAQGAGVGVAAGRAVAAGEGDGAAGPSSPGKRIMQSLTQTS